MGYESFTREELIREIEQLQKRNTLLQQMKDRQELTEFPWIGNLGQWNWDIGSNVVSFNEKKVTALGYVMDEIEGDVGFEFFTSRLHPDDYEPVMQNMRNHLQGMTESYEVEYRIRKKDGSYIWYYDRGMVVTRDEQGKPLMMTGIVFDISKNKEMESKLLEANKKLEEQAMRDALTGAFNRRHFTEHLNGEMNRFKRDGRPFSLLMCDIDHFKRINDEYGHLVGDCILTDFAETVQQNIRRTDLLARWGGEEFIILLLDTEAEGAHTIAEKIRWHVENQVFSKGIHITVSIGVNTYDDSTIDFDELIEGADKAMYEAKESGRNKVVRCQ